MKKIVMENGGIHIEGESGENSISFIRYNVSDTYAIRTKGVVARLDENGDIVCEDLKIYDAEHLMLYQMLIKMQQKYAKGFYIISMIMFILNLVSVFVFPEITDMLYAFFLFFWGASLGSGSVSMFFEGLKGNKKIISIMRFHSAEHAAINAYYDLHRVPTLDEIRNYSRFSYTCGSLKDMLFVFTMWLLSLTRFVPGPWYIYFFAVLFFCTVYFKDKKKLFFMEFLVTRKPTDKEYQVAISGLEKALKEIEEIPEEIDKEIIETIPMLIATIFGKFDSNEFSDENCKGCPFYDLCKEKVEEDN